MEVDVKMCNFRPTCKHLQIEIAATASPRGSHASFSGSADVVVPEIQRCKIRHAAQGRREALATGVADVVVVEIQRCKIRHAAQGRREALAAGIADVVAIEIQPCKIRQLGHRLPCPLGEPRDVLEVY